MTIQWSDNRVELIDANRPFQDVIDLAYNLSFDDWLVIRRPFGNWYGNEWVEAFFYAYRPEELINYSHINQRATDQSIPAIDALDLHEVSASPPVDPVNVPTITSIYLRQPSQTRVVQLTSGPSEPVAVLVGEILPDSLLVTGTDPEFDTFTRAGWATANGHGSGDDGATASMDGMGAGDEAGDDGAMASMDGMRAAEDPGDESAMPAEDGGGGGGGDPEPEGTTPMKNGGGQRAEPEPVEMADGDSPDANKRIDVVLSAAGPDRLQVGRIGVIQVQLELEGEAAPLDVSMSTSLRIAQDVLVTVQADGDSVEIVGDHRKTTPPPKSGEPRSLMFNIRAVAPGVTKFEVTFLQDNARVGSIALATKVLKRAATSTSIARSQSAREPDSYDERKLTISVIAPSVFDPNQYRYEATSRLLNWNAEQFESPTFELGLTGFREYVKDIYTKLEGAFSPTVTDLEDSLDMLEGIGLELGQALFSEEFVSELWKHRKDIGSIELRSFDPYIPWELVKLWNPDSQSKTPDDKFLGEYGLVRHFSGDFAPMTLGKRSWNFVIGDYKNQPGFDPVGEELDFFTKDLLDDLESPPVSVRAQKQAIKAMFKSGEADVIHLACHGEADQSDIASANLIVGVRPKVGGFSEVTLSTNDVRSSLKLNERRPIVFLNACQTGRLGVTAGKTSGWPRVLWEGGAGAVIGTHWKVRSKAARSFAIAFYESLLAGDPLGEAAGKGRTAARANGDVSWMAYVVYGDPSARMIES